MGNEHWIKTTLSAITTQPQYGWTSKATSKGKYKYFRTTDIKTPVNWENVPFCAVLPPDPNKFTLKVDDLLISRAGSVGLSIRIIDDHPSVIFASYLIRIRPLDCIIPKLLEYYFQSHEYWLYISRTQTGIAVPNVNATKLSELPFLLPPIDEQQQIVEKLDAILPKIRKLKERLEKIPVLLKKFRQSILSSACTGKLTEDWRDGKDLPEWEQRQLGELCDIITKGASPKWQGINYVSSPGVLFVTSENVYSFELKTDNKKYVELEFNNKQKRSILKEGDLLTNIVGASIGRTAIYNLPDLANINQAVALIRIKDSYNKQFYLLYLNSPEYISFLDNEKVDVARANISLSNLKELSVPFPPSFEQDEIVRRVEKLLALANSMETKYKEATARIEKIEQSVLAKAFRGELVEASQK